MTISLHSIARRATVSDLDAIVALQRVAYAANRAILGVEPLPLLADYGQIITSMEVWLTEGPAGLEGVLILETRPTDLLIWSVATAPSAQGRGLGRQLLAAAEVRAAELGHTTMRLYTGTKLSERVAWYQRHGYVIERIEEMPERSVTHMVKRLG